jgi:hypothetical protein
MKEEPSFLWSQEDVEFSPLPLEVVGEGVTAGEEGGIRQLDDGDEEGEGSCAAWDWNEGSKLSYCEIDDIMTCSASKALKALARELMLEGNWCLGDPDLLDVRVHTHCDRVSDPQVAVTIGTAGEYVILTKSGISTVSDSNITGDIVVSPIAGRNSPDWLQLVYGLDYAIFHIFAADWPGLRGELRPAHFDEVDRSSQRHGGCLHRRRGASKPQWLEAQYGRRNRRRDARWPLWRRTPSIDCWHLHFQR